EDGPMRDFQEALDTAIHETSHAYQHVLIDQLKEVDAGTRTPPPPRDWEMDQARLFQLNNDAYEDGGDNDAYKNEPLEKHAWLAGNTAALLFNIDAQALDLKKDLDRVAGQYPDKAVKLAEEWQTLDGLKDKPIALRGA